jgi:hypothetical protein
MESGNEMQAKTKSSGWIPARYRALVASITLGLLYFELFRILFAPTDAGNYACGSLVRPILSQDDPEDPVAWFWNIIGDLDKTRCPRTITGLYWEFLFVAAGILIAGLVLRRAVRRQEQE